MTPEGWTLKALELAWGPRIVDGEENWHDPGFEKAMAAIVREAVLEEREECARMVEESPDYDPEDHPGMAAARIIRARAKS